jgi:hypothetical protein
MYTTKYTHVHDGKRISCQHTECDPEFQKFRQPTIDTGKTPIGEYQENEVEVSQPVDTSGYSLYNWRYAICGIIVAVVISITILIMVLK